MSQHGLGNADPVVQAAAELLGQARPGSLSVQTARVFKWVTRGESDGLPTRAVLVEAFRRRVLTTNRALKRLEAEVDGWPSPEAAAVSFAAAAFPRLAFQGPQEPLGPFCQQWAPLRTAGQHNPIDQWAPISPPGFLDDLGGVDSDGQTRLEMIQRRRGAALYLHLASPSGPPQEWICHWQKNRHLVRLMRRLLSFPSAYCLDADDRFECLKQTFPRCDEKAIRTIMQLETSLRSRPEVHRYGLELEIESFWYKHLEKLRSGFAFYRFAAPYTPWFWTEARYFLTKTIDRKKKESEADNAAIPPNEEPSVEFTPQTLYMVKENYRLVRTTFSRQRLADAIWSYYLHRRWFGLHYPQTLADIAQEFEVGLKPIAQPTHQRLKQRMQAICGARLTGLSNPIVLQRINTPIERKICLSLANLGRVPWYGQTLLWIAVARIAWFRCLNLGRVGEWRNKEILAEIYRWCSDPWLIRLLERNRRRRPEQRILEPLANAPLQEFLRIVKESPSEIEFFHRLSSCDSEGIVDAMRRLAHACVPPCSRGRVKFPAGLKREASLWWPPIWYLVHVDSIDNECILTRLRVEPDDRSVAACFLQIALNMCSQEV